MSQTIMESIIILTYNCNFRCTYCDIEKREYKMNHLILEKSIEVLNQSNISIEKLKFFGGEPLLEKDKIIHTVNTLGTKVGRYFVTTNGVLIDKDFIEYSRMNNLQITLSIDGDPITTLENRKSLSGVSMYDRILRNIINYESQLRVNQVITPNNVDGFVKNFIYLYDLGFRQFNFLPEYYTEWSKESLKQLLLGFKEISDMHSIRPIYLVNSENYSPMSFFNIGIVIDCDGSIYGTNLILSGKFEKYKEDLKISTVFTLLPGSGLFPDGEDEYVNKLSYLVQSEYSQQVLNSVQHINFILSSFTLSYGK